MRREISCPVCGSGRFGVSVEDSADGHVVLVLKCTSCQSRGVRVFTAEPVAVGRPRRARGGGRRR